ncbi:MAG TPA: hypothetical protein VFC41_04330 [Anaerovoracaceae bacterium]|nr:hypothetical protein [Anaerovoracaceae bacterium]
MKEVIVSWSGGKDSCLACYKAMGKGYQIGFLLNLISKEYQRCSFHGIRKELINLQANLIGVPLFQKEVSKNMELYEKEFKEAVLHLKTKGAKGMVFGHIGF